MNEGKQIQIITVKKIFTKILTFFPLLIVMAAMYLWLCVFTNHIENQIFILIMVLFYSPCLYLFAEYLWYNINVKVQIDEITNKIHYSKSSIHQSIPLENIKSIELWEAPTAWSMLKIFYLIRIQLGSGERIILTCLLLPQSKKEIEQNRLFDHLNKKMTLLPSIVFIDRFIPWWQSLPK